jgi:D-galactarolactone cycloisomerase
VLTVGANQDWMLRDAVAFSRLVQDANLHWFEEPVRRTSDRLDMAAAHNLIGIPICAGQIEISRSGCRDLMLAGAIGVSEAAVPPNGVRGRAGHLLRGRSRAS